MTIQELGSLGELIAAIATVAAMDLETAYLDLAPADAPEERP